MIYLASPYTHDDPAVMAQRFDAVCHAAGALMKSGKHVYSPIVHSHPIATRCGLPIEWEYWRDFDTRMIAACDELWVLNLHGVTRSRGVAAEIQIARDLGKPVSYCDPDNWFFALEPGHAACAVGDETEA